MKSKKSEWKQFANVMWIIGTRDVLPIVLIIAGVCGLSGYLYKEKDNINTKIEQKQINTNFATPDSVVVYQNQKQRD